MFEECESERRNACVQRILRSAILSVKIFISALSCRERVLSDDPLSDNNGRSMKPVEILMTI